MDGEGSSYDPWILIGLFSRTDFLASLTDENMSPFLLRSLNILWCTVTLLSRTICSSGELIVKDMQRYNDCIKCTMLGENKRVSRHTYIHDGRWADI